MSHLHHFAEHSRLGPHFGLSEAKMQHCPLPPTTLLADVTQFFGEEQLNPQLNYQQQLYAAPGYIINGERDPYRLVTPPYQQVQPLLLNSFVENNGLIDEAQYHQQRQACPPQQASWQNSRVTDRQLAGRQWDHSRRAMQREMQQQRLQTAMQWDQSSFPQVDQENAPSVRLGLVQATPPQTPPSEVEAPPSCRGREQKSSESSLVVQNTFLNVPKARSPSLEPFFKERLVKSSPPSGPSSGTQTPNPSLTDANNPRIPQWLRRQECPDGIRRMDPGFAAAAAAARLTREFGGKDEAKAHSDLEGNGNVGTRIGAQQMMQQHGYPVQQMMMPGRVDIHQDIDTSPVLGSDEVPSVGSQMHRMGSCKPCAFVLKDEGCANGRECPFCHLCEPGEKKRRKKERLVIRREARQEARKQRQLAAMGWNV